jgi:hypothetical protein
LKLEAVTTAPIVALRGAEGWELGARSHCLHCRGDAPTVGQAASSVFYTKHGIYFRGVVRCRCGHNAFCLPIIPEGGETPEAGPPGGSGGGPSPDPGGAPAAATNEIAEALAA